MLWAAEGPHTSYTLSKTTASKHCLWEILYIGAQLHFLESKLIHLGGAQLHPSPFSNSASKIPRGKRSTLLCCQDDHTINLTCNEKRWWCPPCISASSTRWRHGLGVLVSTADVYQPHRIEKLPHTPPVLWYTYLLASSSLLAWLFSTNNLRLLLNGSCLLMNAFNVITPALEVLCPLLSAKVHYLP